MYRFFGKAGLQVAIAVAIILANLQGPKLTVIFGLQTSLGVIFYSSIFFATDVLSENYGKAAANKAVRMGFAVSVIVLIMLSLALLYLPSDKPGTAEFSASIHNAFATIVNFTPRFIFGSLLAYYISQHFDVWAFHKIKSMTGERWLWLRNNRLDNGVAGHRYTDLLAGCLVGHRRPQDRAGARVRRSTFSRSPSR